jgi:outer membrane receptor protein involved in Fe transport
VGNVDLTGKYLTDVPKHSFTLGALMRSSWIDAGLTGRYTGGMYINDQNVYDDIVRSDQYPAVITLDLKLERVFLQRYKASLILQNLLDEKIYESKMAIGPGRFIVFELGVRL